MYLSCSNVGAVCDLPDVFDMCSLLSACREGRVVKASLDVGIWHMQGCQPPKSGRPH